MECWLANRCAKKHCSSDFCLIKYKLEHLYDNANISATQRQYKEIFLDSDGTDKQEFTQLKNVQENILDFVTNGKQLLIHSKTCGCGKTLWSLRLVQAYFSKIWKDVPVDSCKALFISVPSLLIALKDNISNKNNYVEHIKNNVLTCDLVIWDDIGTKNSTVFEAENLFSMIEGRIANGKANIFTSNLLDAELHDALGDRLASRICNLGLNIVFNGGDKRGITNE